MLKNKIKLEINEKLKNADIKIFTNDNKYFNTIIISDDFNDKTLIERQKMIYDIIGKYILNKEIHAISFKTYTKQEWTVENND